MSHIDSTAVRSALKAIEAFEWEMGFEGDVAPHEALRAYSSISGGTGQGRPGVEEWHPVYLAETLQDFTGDIGHLCDVLAISYPQVLSVAFETEIDAVDFQDGELDEPITPGAIDVLDMPLHNLHRASAALQSLRRTADASPVVLPAEIGAYMRQLRSFASQLGVDADKAMLTGAGAWSAERRHPDEAVSNDVVAIRAAPAPVL